MKDTNLPTFKKFKINGSKHIYPPNAIDECKKNSKYLIIEKRRIVENKESILQIFILPSYWVLRDVNYNSF